MLASGSELLTRALKRTPRNKTLADAAKSVLHAEHGARASGSRRSPSDAVTEEIERNPLGAPAHDQRTARPSGGTRASGCRELVRIVPPIGGGEAAEERQLDQRNVPHGGTAPAGTGATRLRRRVPAADPSDRHELPQGPEQLADRRTERPGIARGRSGRRTADTTRSTRTSAPRPTSSPSSTRAKKNNTGGRAGPRAAVLAGPSVGARSIRSGSRHLAGRQHRLRREPAEEVPGHLPAQLRQRPGRHCARKCLRIVRHWIDLGVRIFRVDNPHTKPLPFWEWLLHEVALEHPDVVFLAEAFTTPGDDADPRRRRIPAVLHLLHLAQHEARTRRVPHRAVPRDQRAGCARTCS